MADVPVIPGDGVELSAFTLDDVSAHLAGEDPESIRWLTDGQASTVVSTYAWAERSLDWWRNDGPRRLFAIREAESGRLAGMVEANLDHDSCGLLAGEVNVSYQVYPWARGKGLAVRALGLMCRYLATLPEARVAVLRIDPDNAASQRVAYKAGFVDAGQTATDDGKPMLCFKRQLVQPLNGTRTSDHS